MTTENKPLAHQLQDRVYSSLTMLERQELSEGNPELPGVLALATSLNEKLSDITGIESVTDELARKAESGDDEAAESAAESISDDDPIGGEAAREYWAHRDREKAGNISAGSAYDDVTLRLERVDTLLMAISDAEISGEARDLANLASIARSEIAAAERVCQDNSKKWDEPQGGAS